MRSTHITTTTAAVAAVRMPSASMLYGVAATGAGNAATYYIKFWWEGTGIAPPATPSGAQPATVLAVPGTTVPHLTIQIPTTGAQITLVEPLNNGGNLWYWITTGLADNSTSVLVTGGDVVTFMYD
jgi:hypothetical protein